MHSDDVGRRADVPLREANNPPGAKVHAALRVHGVAADELHKVNFR